MRLLAALLVLGGLALAARGVRREAVGLRLPVTDPAKALALVRVLRTGILGLAFAGVGAGLARHVGALVGVSLVIAGEELLETSVVVAALRRRA